MLCAVCARECICTAHTGRSFITGYLNATFGHNFCALRLHSDMCVWLLAKQFRVRRPLLDLESPCILKILIDSEISEFLLLSVLLLLQFLQCLSNACVQTRCVATKRNYLLTKSENRIIHFSHFIRAAIDACKSCRCWHVNCAHLPLGTCVR